MNEPDAPLFIATELDEISDPNCPLCLQRMVLNDEDAGWGWHCADPDCGATMLF